MRMPDARVVDVGRGIWIAYEEFGARDATPLLLIAGVGTQMLGWREALCRTLAAEGLRVVRSDNRDSGESTKIEDRRPDMRRVFAGDTSSAPYRLEDMADDVAGLLDALELGSAHVVGASMGGMIAQTLALEHPQRVRSLTSVMSTTGDAEVSRPTDAAMQALFRPMARSADDAAENAAEAAAVIGSPGYPPDLDEIRATARCAYERGYYPVGFMRQMAAIYASGDRTERLRRLRIPTLVIHGEDDPLVRFGAGKATAAAIEGAALRSFPGMAHDLPRQLWPQLTEAIAAHVHSAEPQAAAA